MSRQMPDIVTNIKYMQIKRAEVLAGDLNLPGDKSISHRAAIMAAMAFGETRIENYADSEDCRSTLDCLEQLGVEIKRNGAVVTIKGVGKKGFVRPTAPLDCGNSGTTMRLLAGVLAGQSFKSVLTGDDSLRKRPMKRIIEPLELMGAVIAANGENAPLHISGKQALEPVIYDLPVASAQTKSCILLAALNANGRTSVIEPVQTRDHTERMLRWFGVDVIVEKSDEYSTISVNGGGELAPHDIVVPGDISSAAYFMVAAACLRGSDITIRNVGFNPTRRAICDVLKSVGADVGILGNNELCNEPVASLRIRGGFDHSKSNSTQILHGPIIANLIDEIPILAILGTQLEYGLEIHNAAELRAKESDRIRAIVENLKRMGAEITEYDDGFKVERSNLKGAVVNSFGDHRIAMSFAVAGLLAENMTEIVGANAADISFPAFFETLAGVVR